jgi:hypothetical protein
MYLTFISANTNFIIFISTAVLRCEFADVSEDLSVFVFKVKNFSILLLLLLGMIVEQA